jgi:hypothetical protein
VKLLTVTPAPKETDEAEPKFCPVIVSDNVDPRTPLAGLRPEIVGAGAHAPDAHVVPSP